MHRGYEKLTEVRTYPQVTTLINRIDWLGSFANEVPFILAAEKLMDIEAPPAGPVDPHDPVRAVAASPTSSLFLGDMGVQLGALTPVFYAFRDREYVLNLIEAVTGGRFHPNFDRIGGLKDDLPEGLDRRDQAGHAADARLLRRDRRPARRQRDLPEPAPAASASSRPRSPCSTGCRAPTSRASGVDWDLRRDQPLPLAWDKVDWKVWTHPDGDCSPATGCACRRPARRRKIVDQLLDGMPGRADHGQGAAHHQGARGRGVGRAPRTRSARWATTSSARATSARSG